MNETTLDAVCLQKGTGICIVRVYKESKTSLLLNNPLYIHIKDARTVKQTSQ